MYHNWYQSYLETGYLVFENIYTFIKWGVESAEVTAEIVDKKNECKEMSFEVVNQTAPFMERKSLPVVDLAVSQFVSHYNTMVRGLVFKNFFNASQAKSKKICNIY